MFALLLCVAVFASSAMSCYAPQPYLIRTTGGSPVHLHEDYPRGYWPGMGRVVYLPCGNCLQCRIAKRKDLTALQCLEASLHLYNWFLTLTYDDDHLPFGGSLVRRHLQDFCQSLRKRFSYDVPGFSFRYLACGEYGEASFRPHYHLSIFGLPPGMLGLDWQHVDDLRMSDLSCYGVLSRVSFSSFDSNGNNVWLSPVVSKFWTYGSHKLYLANKNTFQYVAGYVTKKLKDTAPDLVGLEPEFRVQSRPSIGRAWYDLHKDDLTKIYDGRLYHDCVSGDFGEWRVPRLMLKWMELERGEDFVRAVSRIRQKDFELVPNREQLCRARLHDRLVGRRFDNMKGKKL